jgi:NAD(P)-dependent dehydrogenase (short-subunit alcohol dehydrogenase family)
MTDRRTILITGATAGIGYDAALHFAAGGHHVIATGRRVERLEVLRAAAATGGGRLDILELDVTNQASIDAAAARTLELTQGTGIEVLINNAGYGQPGTLMELSDAEVRAQFETNVFGVLAVTRAFLPQLLRHPSSHLLNVSSIGGRISMPLFGAYHGSKFALESMTDALRMELAPFGVRVVLIEPGPIKTEFGERALAGVARVQQQESPYAPIYARAMAIKEWAERRAASPAAVTRVMARAIRSRRPAARYVAPFGSRLAVLLMAWVPARISDWAMTRALGLTRRGLGVSMPALPRQTA